MRILLLLFLIPGFALGAEKNRSIRTPGQTRAVPKKTQPIFVELGSSFANLRKVTASKNATPSTLGSHQFLLSLATRVSDFRPEIGFTPIARKGAENTHQSRLIVLQFPYLLPATDQANWKIGGSVWIHRISGKGGPIEVSNGTSTQTFSKPGRSATSSVFGLLGGYTFPIGAQLAIDIDATLLAPLSTRRSANLIAQLAWRFHE